MNTHNNTVRLSTLAIAMAGALATMSARADDAEVAALKTPQNFVEAGVTQVSGSSAKFGEYTGLNKSGPYFLGNFGVRGGDAYKDGGGTGRWSIFGSDLGLTSRTFGATLANQGEWNLGFGFDQLRHNITDTYQTPYLGNAGDSRFVLPTGFGLANNTQALTAAQLGAFHTLDIGTTRKNTSLNGGLRLNAQWGVSFDFNHLDQTGAKLMGYGMAGIGGATGEFVAILPNPTNYKTDNFNMALNWTGDKGHATASYFGSLFREQTDRVNFQTFAGANTLQTMSTPPSNSFHQLNLTGGYAFSPATKLAGGLSYGRNTQNETFAFDPGMMVTPSPRTSLNGVVITTHADAKLTNQTTRDLVLSAGVKWDERDNRTESNIYNFAAISGGNIANYPNTPLSFRTAQLELAGDYRLTRDQRLRWAYEREDKHRWCNNYAVGAGFPVGTNCVVAVKSVEDKVGLTYKTKPIEGLDANLGYTYSDRKTDSDPNAIAAFISTNGGVAGQNAGDFQGFFPFFDASRKRHAAKAGLSWQANEKTTVAATGRYTRDSYDSQFGVQDGSSWSLNLDSTYNYSERGSVSAYATRQHRQRDMTNIQRTTASAAAASATAIGVPAGATWSNTLTDDDTTIGLGFKHGGLMGGKLELSGDLTYSMGKAAYGTFLNYATTTTNGASCASASILSCGQLPDINARTTTLKFAAAYQVDKQSKVIMRVAHQRLKSDDFFFNAYQTSFTPTQVLPTNQQTGNYSVNLISLSYFYTF
ncbi:MAG: decaheme-associated outer membrane protein MtrB/PioB family [Ramlibacter sp.]|nr:decaheme-associated outer membrane protein MtrB/PioB family [Ramlibacter sp.]